MVGDLWLEDGRDEEWSAEEAANTLLAYAIAIAERGPGQVALKD
jgi:hypothetical protein